MNRLRDAKKNAAEQSEAAEDFEKAFPPHEAKEVQDMITNWNIDPVNMPDPYADIPMSA